MGGNGLPLRLKTRYSFDLNTFKTTLRHHLIYSIGEIVQNRFLFDLSICWEHNHVINTYLYTITYVLTIKLLIIIVFKIWLIFF